MLCGLQKEGEITVEAAPLAEGEVAPEGAEGPVAPVLSAADEEKAARIALVSHVAGPCLHLCLNCNRMGKGRGKTPPCYQTVKVGVWACLPEPPAASALHVRP